MDIKLSNQIHRGWAVYTRSGCKYSSKVKRLLNTFDLKYNVIDCDYCFIFDEIQEEFSEFLEKLCGSKSPDFPIVFKDYEYIGGYKETLDYLKNKNID
jgi:glutaredoxin